MLVLIPGPPWSREQVPYLREGDTQTGFVNLAAGSWDQKTSRPPPAKAICPFAHSVPELPDRSSRLKGVDPREMPPRPASERFG